MTLPSIATLAVGALCMAGTAVGLAAPLAFAQTASAPVQHTPTSTEEAVAAVETAFAQSMADRDFQAFAAFIDDEAVFWSGRTAARGKTAVLSRWRAFFDGKTAPFSWTPETVLVLESDMLAMSTGPVSAPDGRIFAYFTSTWRKNEQGEWKIIFDKGQRYCPPPDAQP